MSVMGGVDDPVILATASYDHTIRFWQAHSGICHRTVQHPDSVSFEFVLEWCYLCLSSFTRCFCILQPEAPDDAFVVI